MRPKFALSRSKRQLRPDHFPNATLAHVYSPPVIHLTARTLQPIYAEQPSFPFHATHGYSFEPLRLSDATNFRHGIRN